MQPECPSNMDKNKLNTVFLTSTAARFFPVVTPVTLRVTLNSLFNLTVSFHYSTPPSSCIRHTNADLVLSSMGLFSIVYVIYTVSLVSLLRYSPLIIYQPRAKTKRSVECLPFPHDEGSSFSNMI